jgi:hypothetical protein
MFFYFSFQGISLNGPLVMAIIPKQKTLDRGVWAGQFVWKLPGKLGPVTGFSRRTSLEDVSENQRTFRTAAYSGSGLYGSGPFGQRPF